jgi:hypothetical protein
MHPQQWQQQQIEHAVACTKLRDPGKHQLTIRVCGASLFMLFCEAVAFPRQLQLPKVTKRVL